MEKQIPYQYGSDTSVTNTNTVSNTINNNIIKIYEEEIGLLTPYQLETLESYLEDLSEEMIIEAIKRASKYNKKSISYIEGILKNWVKNGYKTLGDIKEKKVEKTIAERIREATGDLDSLYDN